MGVSSVKADASFNHAAACVQEPCYRALRGKPLCPVCPAAKKVVEHSLVEVKQGDHESVTVAGCFVGVDSISGEQCIRLPNNLLPHGVRVRIVMRVEG